MENQTFKKAVFGGFDREDVLNGFERISKQYKEEIDDVSAQVRKLEAEKAQMNEQLETAQKELLEKDEHINKLQQLVRKQNTDNDRLKHLNIAVEKSSKDVKLQNEMLQRQLEETKQELQEKADRLEKIDEVGFQAEKLITEANSRSTTTLAEANNRASAMLTEAAKKASDAMEQATRKAEDLISRASEEADNIKNAAQDYNQQAKRKINDLAAELAEKEKKAGIKASEIIREANARAEEIVKKGKLKIKEANQKYELFQKEVAGVKLSMLQLLKELELKIGLIDQEMPQTVEPDDIVEQEAEKPEESAAEQSPTSDFFR